MTKALKLDQIRVGQDVRLLSFARCRRNGLRLAELGLTPGTRVEVLRAHHGQPMLLRVRGALLAIDRATAGKIEVRRVGERSERCQERPRRGQRRVRGWGRGSLRTSHAEGSEDQTPQPGGGRDER